MAKWKYLIAAVGGSLLSVVSAILLTSLIKFFEFTPPGSSLVLNEFFGKDVGVIHLIAIFSLVLLVPAIEEFLFRGLLWRISGFLFKPTITLILTSLLFAAAHLDILLILALLPLSFFLGWLRLQTNSIKPCIVAHAANNLTAVLLTLI
jgi:membrane protease YdiL (CAAX protease family)